MIHQYKLGGYNIVLDVCSGAVHAVDELAYDIIALFETESRDTIIRTLAEKYQSCDEVTPEEIGACYDQIAALRDAGKLFALSREVPVGLLSSCGKAASCSSRALIFLTSSLKALKSSLLS